MSTVSAAAVDSKMEPPVKKKQTAKQFCCVPQCVSARWKDRAISFHAFPSEAKDRSRRARWIANLRIGKAVTPMMTVCSQYFAREDFFFPGEALA